MTARRPQRSRDPEGRRAALATAAIEVIAEVGIARTTHRAVAARAGLPLGATTYYFPSLDDLVAAGLAVATEALGAELRSWAERLDTAEDLPGALIGLVEAYLTDRRRARLEYDLYLAAARDPALRPLAEGCLHGFRDLLEPRLGPEAARVVVALLDGAMLQALVTDTDLDGPALTAAIRRLHPR
ncbi:TetR/AcrR family transcriptional regulator [Plantactinospora mayteni]|uniref:DNA-binding transcriptional regulator n=1 Tax=Plantactinospora mayteni TaxID=566021 RepID=A0ABQ4EJ80_9ACTN|nr:TetR family transcriptional regulator [Plantactinospora mayteni]GIG94791.1 DNA-binding transcriptional regulator [Plantactinospora mayteni]